jgi:hypothetical protein
MDTSHFDHVNENQPKRRRHHGDLQAATSQPFFAFYPGETIHENRPETSDPP